MEKSIMAKALKPSASSDQSNALEFCLRMARAWAVILRRLDNVLSGLHGISFNDFMVLYYLQKAPGMRLRRIDLAERLGLTASGVTRTLLPLEKLGLVGREADARDARVGYATLTKAGQKLLSHALEAADMVSHEIASTTTADQLEEFSSLLGQLAGINLSNS
jgi:DNA-binding MarR family transcriptional regulator